MYGAFANLLIYECIRKYFSGCCQSQAENKKKNENETEFHFGYELEPLQLTWWGWCARNMNIHFISIVDLNRMKERKKNAEIHIFFFLIDLQFLSPYFEMN